MLRLNVADEAGERTQEHFGTEKVPTVILLDAGGNEIYRTEGKLPRKQQIREALAQESGVSSQDSGG